MKNVYDFIENFERIATIFNLTQKFTKNNNVLCARSSNVNHVHVKTYVDKQKVYSEQCDANNISYWIAREQKMLQVSKEEKGNDIRQYFSIMIKIMTKYYDLIVYKPAH